jgi:glucose-6-phosphate 1-epimerase
LSHSIPYREEVTFPGFVDCIYLGAPGELILDNGLGDKIAISNSR